MSARWPVPVLGLCCGCNAVLGITESPLRGDASVSDSGDSGLGVTSCGWVFPKHRKIADLSDKIGIERTWAANILAESIPGSTRSRLIAFHPASNLPLDVFTVDEIGAGSVPAIHLGTNDIALETRRLDAKTIGILSVSRAAEASTGSKIVLYRVNDADSDGAAAVSVDVLDLASYGNVDNVTGVFLPGDGGGVAALTSFAVSGAGRLVLGMSNGTSAATAGTLVASGSPYDIYAEAVIRVGTTTYAFAGAPGGAVGANQFTIADGATGPFTPRTLEGPSAFLGAAGANSAGKVNFLFVDRSSTLDVIFGQVDPGQLETFLPTQFTIVRKYGGLSEVPFTSKPRWSEDRLLDIGPTGKDSVDLKLFWGDPFGGLIVEQVLETVTDGSKVRAASASAGTQFGNFGGILNVFWIQTYVGANSEPYDVLFYDQARCIQ